MPKIRDSEEVGIPGILVMKLFCILIVIVVRLIQTSDIITEE